MMLLEWSLNILLCIPVITMATFTNENAKIQCHSVPNYRNSSNNNCLIPIHYNLDMILLPGISFVWELNATFYINCKISNITLHIARILAIEEVMFKSPNGTIYTPKFDTYNRNNFATFDFIEYLSPENTNLDCGVYTMYVKYKIIFAHQHYGMYYIKGEDRRDKEFLFATFLQPRNARQLFPCWDEPKLKATFNISVKYDKKHSAVSNAILEHDYVYNGIIHSLFHMTSKISVNDVMIIVYDFQPISISKEKNIYLWSKWDLIPYMKWVNYVAGNVSMYLENNWRIISRSELKMDYVVIPIDSSEYKGRTCGVILLNKTNIIYNEEFCPVAFKTLSMRSVTHNILHYWFNNFFYSSCRSSWWLNEGFVVFLESYIIDKIFPGSRMMDLFVVQIRDDSHYLHPFAVNYFKENSNYMFKINSPSPFSHIVGASLWRMLERMISFDVFWTTINIYLNRKFISLDMANTFNDLWSILPIVMSKLKFKNYNLDVRKIIAIWSMQQHYPVLNVTRYYSRNSAIIFLEFQADMDQNPYCIPVTFTGEASINFNVTGSDIYLTSLYPKWYVPFFYPKNWIIFNLQQTGFYRVNYDDENWKLIARYLNSGQYTNIHVLNRAQIIDDSFHLMTQGKLNSSIFWELSSYLWQEKDYVAWYPMFKALEYMSNIIPFSNSDVYRSEVLETILGKIKNLFERVDQHMYDDMASSKYDIDKYLMQEIAKWSCIMNNTLCIEKASNKLRLHIKNPQKNRILPGWQKWTFCNGLLKMNSREWFNICYSAINIYKEKSDHKILEFFSCSENLATILNYLKNYMLNFVVLFLDDEISSTVKRHKYRTMVVNIFFSTIARHVKNETIFQSILKNYHLIYFTYSDYPYNTFGAMVINAALIVMINNAYSQKQLSEIKIFAIHNQQITVGVYLTVKNKLKARSEQLVNQVKFYEDIYAKIAKP